MTLNNKDITMSKQDISQALKWYIDGIDLITIAQHFGVSVEELKRALNNVLH